MFRNMRSDDPEGLHQFKAEFFKALAHPLRIRLIELLRGGPMSVGQLQQEVGIPAALISQHLGILRGRGIVVTERRGTTINYRARDEDLFVLLDVARRIFNAHLTDTIDLLGALEAQPLLSRR